MATLVLDTDHISLLVEEGDSVSGRRLKIRLANSFQGEITSSIITYEEQSRGWLSYISHARTIAAQVEAYRRLARHLNNYRQIVLLDFTESAAVEFQRLRKLGIRIGSMDLKIAAIAITHDAIVLSRNLRDFEKVPGLKAEDWSA